MARQRLRLRYGNEIAGIFVQHMAPEGQDVIVGWVHERADGGRAFATTLGHFYRNFQQDAFRQMIVNGILWTAHVEVPSDGAPIALDEMDLALPPKPPAGSK